MSTQERYLTQIDVEGEITRLSKILETATGMLATASEEAAVGEADYRIAYSKAFLNPPSGEEKLTEKIRESHALIVAEAELRRYKLTAAKQLALQEKCRQLRAQLDAVRTISANVRGQT